MMGEWIIPVVAIVFGTAFTGFVLYLLFSTIKAWISKKNSSFDEESFDRMAKAFIQHKKDTERRLENLEAIVTGEEELPSSRIELDNSEEPQVEVENETPEKKEPTNSSNLKNILKE